MASVISLSQPSTPRRKRKSNVSRRIAAERTRAVSGRQSQTASRVSAPTPIVLRTDDEDIVDVYDDPNGVPFLLPDNDPPEEAPGDDTPHEGDGDKNEKKENPGDNGDDKEDDDHPPSHLYPNARLLPLTDPKKKRVGVSFRLSRDFRVMHADMTDEYKKICHCPVCQPEEHEKCVLRDPPDSDQRCFMCRQEQDPHPDDCNCPRCSNWILKKRNGQPVKFPPVRRGPSRISLLDPIMHPPSPPPGTLHPIKSSGEVGGRRKRNARQKRKGDGNDLGNGLPPVNRSDFVTTQHSVKEARKAPPRTGKLTKITSASQGSLLKSQRSSFDAGTDSQDVFTTQLNPVLIANTDAQPPRDAQRRNPPLGSTAQQSSLDQVEEEVEEEVEQELDDHQLWLEARQQRVEQRVDDLPEDVKRLLYSRYGQGWREELLSLYNPSGAQCDRFPFDCVVEMLKAPPRVGDRLPTRRINRPGYVPPPPPRVPLQTLKSVRASGRGKPKCASPLQYTEKQSGKPEVRNGKSSHRSQPRYLSGWVVPPNETTFHAVTKVFTMADWNDMNSIVSRTAEDELKIRLAAVSIGRQMDTSQYNQLEDHVKQIRGNPPPPVQATPQPKSRKCRGSSQPGSKDSKSAHLGRPSAVRRR